MPLAPHDGGMRGPMSTVGRSSFASGPRFLACKMTKIMQYATKIRRFPKGVGYLGAARVGSATLLAVAGLAVGALGCQAAVESTIVEEEGSGAPSASAAAAKPAELDQGHNSVAPEAPADQALLGITEYATTIYAEPRKGSKKLGYARVGAKLPRSEEPAGKKGCKQGWYEVFPRGFVCVGKGGTLDMDAPILRAASKRPDLIAPLPYRYAFVRAVLPLYLRIPDAEEQEKAEFKLKEHLEWYAQNKSEVDRVVLGAPDVPVDSRGVPIKGKELGELGELPNSTEVGLGILFGGETEDDPIPWWLENGKTQNPEHQWI